MFFMRSIPSLLVAPIFILAVAAVARADDLAGPLNAQPAAQSAVSAPKKQHKAKRPAPPTKSSASAQQAQLPSADPQTDIAPTPAARSANGTSGEPSLGLNWHATNDKVDPYDAVNHESGPYGQGFGFQGGVKFGF
jgi:hypothetical protein